MKNYGKFLLTVFAIQSALIMGCGSEPPTQPTRPELVSILVTPNPVTLNALDATQVFEATGEDSRGNRISDLKVTWSVSPDSVASIISSGIATAEANGEATVVAEARGVRGTAELTVWQEPHEVSISPNAATATALGVKQDFDAKALDRNGNKVNGIAFTWSVTPDSIATIDDSGLVTAEANGEATIIAKSESLRGTAKFTVRQDIASVSVSPEAATVNALEATQDFEATAVDENRNEISGVDFTWSVRPDSVASIDEFGTATAEATGEATVIADAGGVTGSARLNVRQDIATISVTPDSAVLDRVSAIKQFTATAKDRSGITIPDVDFQWISRGEDVATVTSTGKVTAEGSGLTEIQASASGVSDSATVRVATGHLTVITETEGRDIDQNGYLVSVADRDRIGIGPNDSLRINNISTGTYNIEVSEISNNCGSVSGNPISVDISFDSLTTARFDLKCLSQDGVFAFQSNRDGQREVYIQNVDGSNLRRITDNPARDFRPGWSPDGEMLIFTSDRGGSDGIYTHDLQTGAERLLTDSATVFGNPDWSPDGRLVVFELTGTGGFDWEIATVDTSTKKVRRLTNNDPVSSSDDLDEDPAWSPDGSQIAFASWRASDGDIFVMDADGSNVTRITSGPTEQRDGEPAWSPDGTQIAFIRSTDSTTFNLFVMNADGSNVRQLTNSAVADRNPSWGPSGNRILFSRNLESDPVVMMIDPEGVVEVQVTTEAAHPVWKK